jgi:hypothetical protein
MLPQNSAKQALLLTALKKVLRYDPHTGLFHWKIETQAHGGRIKPGDPAGTLRSDGYVQIGGTHLPGTPSSVVVRQRRTAF